MAINQYSSPDEIKRYTDSTRNRSNVEAGGGNSRFRGMDRDTYADWLGQNIDSTVSKDQWGAWLDENGGANLDPNCPPSHPFQTNGYDAQGNKMVQCVEKPDDCPEGTVASHIDKSGKRICSDPANLPGGGGNGGGGGTGGGGTGGYASAAWENPYYNKLMAEYDAKRTASADDLFAETGLAGDMGSTMDAFRQSLDADPTFANNPQLKAQMLAKAKADQLSGAQGGIQAQRKMYTDALAGMSGDRENRSEDWSKATMSDLTNRYGIDKNTALGYYNADIDKDLGWANIGMQGKQMDTLTDQWQKSFDQSNYQWNQNRLDQQKAAKDAANAQKKSLWGNLFGTVANTVLSGSKVAALFSDERVKENLKDSTEGLEEVKKLQPKSYRYKGDAPTPDAGKRGVSYSAQDVEKVSPRSVKTVKEAGNYRNVKMLDIAKMMAMHTNAIKELDAKVTSIYGGKR